MRLIATSKISQRSAFDTENQELSCIGAFRWSKPVLGSLVPSTANMSIDFPKEEEEVLRRWKEIKAFETQVELSKSRPLYTFYDGPPFAT